MTIRELQEVWDELTAPGQLFSTSDVEVRGVTLKSYDLAPVNLREIFVNTVASKPDVVHLVFDEERYTFGQVDVAVRSAAAGLAAMGVSSGDRVAISMRNYPEWIIAYWAVISLGGVAVCLNAWWTAPELAYALNDSAAMMLICDRERLERFDAAKGTVGDLALVVVRAEEARRGVTAWSDLVADTDPPALPDVPIDTDDDAMVLYTSGTTGFPKGAALTHRSCTNNLFNIMFWTATSAEYSRRARPAVAPKSTDHPLATLLAVPLFHVTGCNCVMQPAMLAGGKLVMMYKWDPERALELVERERITTMTGVPTMSREMLASPDWATRDTSSLAAMGGGGAQLQPDLVKKIDDSLPTGRPGTGYGLTEVSGVISMNSADLYLDKPGTVGPVLPSMDARIVDVVGHVVSPGERGELEVKGANVIRGYLNKPEATAEAIVDGWFKTGDIAFLDDDGFITIADRAKDMLIRGGENIYCAEVEMAIYEHDAIAECAVFGVPDDRLGEVAGAAVVIHPGHDLDEAGLRAHCAARIAAFKVPERIWFLDALPRNANGKFLKRQLRDELVEPAVD